MSRLYEMKIEELSTRLHRHDRLAGSRLRDARVYGSLAFAWGMATAVSAIYQAQPVLWMAWGAGLLIWLAATTAAVLTSREHRKHSARLRVRIDYLRDMDRLLRRNTPKRHL